MQRNLAAIAMRVEDNKERFNWRERAAPPFEEKYSKHTADLKRSHEERHAGGKSDLDQSCNAIAKKKKKKKELISFRGSLSEVEKIT